MPQRSIDLAREHADRIGERLRWARELVEANPIELAADVGCDPSSIRHIESGRRLPSIHLLISLCHVLRLSPEYLLWGSLVGVDPEMAVRLKQLHPELQWPSSLAAHNNTYNSLPNSAGVPRIRRRRTNLPAAG